MTVFIARTDASLLGRWWWSIDRYLLISISALIAIGVLLVAAASPAVARRIGLPEFHFLLRHIVYLGPTLTIILCLSFLPPLYIRRLAVVILASAAVAVLLTFFIGTEIKGARRWLHIPGASIQPSEFLKPSFAVVAAWLFAHQHQKQNFPGYGISCGIWAALAVMLMLQPDLGMTVVITLVWATQFFMAGLRLSIVAAIGVFMVVGLIFIYLTFPHVTSRIDRFLDPSAGDTYQVDKALEAFGRGGLLGSGPGQGDVKRVLPDAHADFIYAVSGEELGLIITLLLTGLFLTVTVRGLTCALKQDNLFIRLAIAGLSVQFGGQALIHMGSSLQLLPAKGMTLPFVSYGGSSLLSLGLAVGMLLALTRADTRRSHGRIG